jgi:hypothetical protein
MSVVGMAGVPRFLHCGTFLQFNLALTTVAARGATIADVIGTGVLGAGSADAGGFLPADTTVKSHD